MLSESFKEYEAWPVPYIALEKISFTELKNKILHNENETSSRLTVLKNLLVEDSFELESIKFEKHLVFENCFFSKNLSFNHTNFENSLQFKSCRIRNLKIKNSTLKGELILKSNLIYNFSIDKIETNNKIYVYDNTFKKSKRKIFFLDIESNDSIKIENNSFENGIDFKHSLFKSFIFKSNTLIAIDEIALNLNGTKCSSFIKILDSKIYSTISLINSIIEDDLLISNCQINPSGKDKNLLIIHRSKICNLILRNSHIKGSLSLSGNEISKRLEVATSYILEGGSLEIIDCKVNSPSIVTSLHLTNEIKIYSCKFNDVFQIIKTSYLDNNNDTNKYFIKVSHSDFEKTFIIDEISSSNPSILITNSTYHKDLVLSSINYYSAEKSIAIVDTNISSRLILSKVKHISNCILKNSYCKIIQDEIHNWENNNSFLNFKYNLISENSIHNLQSRIKWIKNISQTKNNHDECYAVLLNSYKEMNLHEDFNNLSFYIKDHKREIATGYYRITLTVYRNLIGYGYKPKLLVNYILFLIFFGSLVYYHASATGIMAPTQAIIYTNKNIESCSNENWIYCEKLPREYTSFNPFIYSIDTMLPFVDLGQENNWSIKTSSNKKLSYESISKLELGNIVRWFQWVQIIFGWISSLVIIAWISGFIKPEKSN